MSDLELLYLILAALYVWECLCWLPRGSVAVTTWLGRHWRLAQPGDLVGNQRGGFVLAPPLPPLGTFFTAAQFPLSLSPDGLLVYVATNVNPGWRAAQSGQYLPFTDVREVRVFNKKVLVNGKVLLKFPFPQTARYLAETIDRLVKLPTAKRAAAIEDLVHDQFDLAIAKKRWEEHRAQSRGLHWAVNLLFVYLFITVPAVIIQVGFKPTWLGLLLGLFAVTITAAVLFWRAHRRFYLREDDDRFTHTLTIALSPATATRAHDLLSRPLLQNFHPLIPAKMVLEPDAFREFAARVLRDVRTPALPVAPSDHPAVLATELHARTVLGRNIEEFVKRAGLSPDELCRPPQPTDDSCRSYCPRCHSQFTTTEGICADCGGLALVRFDGR